MDAGIGAFVRGEPFPADKLRTVVDLPVAALSASGSPAAHHVLAQLAEQAREVGALVGGGPAARVRQHPDARAAERLGLAADARGAVPERRAVRADAQEGDAARAQPAQLRGEPARARRDLVRRELVGGGRRARHQVREAAAVGEQRAVLGGREQALGEAGRRGAPARSGCPAARSGDRPRPSTGSG